MDAEHERGGEDGPDRGPEDRADGEAAAAPEPGDAQQQGRPNEVELLLDRQRPEVLERARFDPLGEVVDRLRGEVPVGDIEGGADDVAGDFLAADGREQQRRRQGNGGEHDQHQRQQTARPARVEADQRDAAGAVHLPHQQPGDQEAGDDEEDVDPDVSPREEGDPGMAEEHSDDRDRAQALDVGAEAALGCLRR